MHIKWVQIKKIDTAIQLKDDIDQLLQQEVLESYPFEETISIMNEIYEKKSITFDRGNGGW